jgi:transposase
LATDQKKWQELKATLIFEDESGFSLVSPLKRTWSPCGQTPVVRTSLDHHQRLNLLGAVQVPFQGTKALRLRVRSFTCTLTGIQVIVFLKQLLRLVQGELVLVWDNHPIHQRKAVEEFMAHEPRLHVYCFPACAPELNPAEFPWTQLKEHTASTAPHDLPELRRNVRTGTAKIRRSQSRLRYCLKASQLSWKYHGNYLFKTQ